MGFWDSVGKAMENFGEFTKEACAKKAEYASKSNAELKAIRDSFRSSKAERLAAASVLKSRE